ATSAGRTLGDTDEARSGPRREDARLEASPLSRSIGAGRRTVSRPLATADGTGLPVTRQRRQRHPRRGERVARQVPAPPHSDSGAVEQILDARRRVRTPVDQRHVADDLVLEGRARRTLTASCSSWIFVFFVDLRVLRGSSCSSWIFVFPWTFVDLRATT